jgi:enamine deaminase RidA (YjgF/YER057c/UK114 family)
MTLDPLNPAALGRPRGWTHGMLTGPGDRILFVAGMTAQDRSGKVPDVGFVEQWDLALGNVRAVLTEAGVGPEAVARMTVFVTDIAVYRLNLKEIGAVWRRHMGKHFPAMALVEVLGLVDPMAMIEIETTAVVPG